MFRVLEDQTVKPGTLRFEPTQDFAKFHWQWDALKRSSYHNVYVHQCNKNYTCCWLHEAAYRLWIDSHGTLNVEVM